jgi:hypothetical protein
MLGPVLLGKRAERFLKKPCSHWEMALVVLKHFTAGAAENIRTSIDYFITLSGDENKIIIAENPHKR